MRPAAHPRATLVPQAVKSKSRKAAPPAPPTVDAFLAASDHAHKPAIELLRRVILAAHPSIREAVKWNSPSFHTTEFFATIHLRASTGIAVVLHFGAKKNVLSVTGAPIPDPESLLVWLAPDRAMVTFLDLRDLETKQSAFSELIRQWIQHV